MRIYILKSALIEQKNDKQISFTLRFKRPMSISPDFHVHMEHLSALTEVVELLRQNGIINPMARVPVIISRKITDTKADVLNHFNPNEQSETKPHLCSSLPVMLRMPLKQCFAQHLIQVL